MREHTGYPTRRDMFPLRRLKCFPLDKACQGSCSCQNTEACSQRWIKTYRITQRFLETGSEKGPQVLAGLRNRRNIGHKRICGQTWGWSRGFYGVINESTCRFHTEIYCVTSKVCCLCLGRCMYFFYKLSSVD